MSREVRRIPPNWSHPTRMALRYERGIGFCMRLEYVPMHESGYEQALATWDEGKARHDAGERPDHMPPGVDYDYVEDMAGPRPDPVNYRPFTDDEATWYQLFESVSEGTPVSPPFATLDELVAYLSENGDFWDQDRAVRAARTRIDPDNPPRAGWGREAAERFCGIGWGPTTIAQDGVVARNAGEAAMMAGGPRDEARPDDA